MPGWALVNFHPTQGRTFERPLSPAEVAFALDARIKGTTDSGQYFQLRLLNGSRDARLFSNANIIQAWISTKRRFPLAGAIIRDLKTEGGTSHNDLFDDPKSVFQPRFVVRECDLAIVHPNEVVFGEAASREEMEHKLVTILDGPRTLSEDLPVQLRVHREIDSHKANVLHVMMLTAHVVSDATAITTLTRCFVDTLARGCGPSSDPEPAQHPLEERLAMVVPPAELLPKQLRSFNLGRRRWRLAIGHVIYQLMMKKNLGGHTLPCRITRSTPITPARAGFALVSFTESETASVLATCRLHNLTYGNAYLPLAQVAMTRVLYRRYLRGEISEEEWTYRKRQPYLTVGPLSLRPRLDKEWFEKGGGGDFVLSGWKQSRRLLNGAPPFSDLLTFDRFLYRAELVKRQARALFEHPLFAEIVHVAGLAHVRRAWLGTLQWKNKRSGEEDEVLAVTDIPVAVAHGGSTLGDVDVVSPTEYPLPPTHPLSPYAPVSHPMRAGYVNHPPQSPPNSEVTTTPKIAMESGSSTLCAHPGELYLGAASSRGRMRMYVYYDRNVFEDGVVKEWLDEVKGAVLWYLGGSHQSRRAQWNRVAGDGRADLVAKL